MIDISIIYRSTINASTMSLLLYFLLLISDKTAREETMITSSSTSCQVASPEKHLSKHGMKVSWSFSKDSVSIEMSAPNQGWVAIGFNEKEGLAGTNLIMGSVVNGNVQLSDRYILKPGEHRSMEELGLENKLREARGEEEQGRTHISFKLPIHSTDAYHKTLLLGKPFHLLMAFSQEDDFIHHSIMRTSAKIIL